MNANQKQRAQSLLNEYRPGDDAPHVYHMAALLQELVDAHEPKPVARVTGYYAGYLSIATVDGRVLPAGTALYLSPPAPSVPEGWRLVPYTPTVLMLERAGYAVNNRPQPSKYEPSATPAIIFWTAMLNYAPEAPQDAEAPADLVQDSVASEPVGYLYTNLQSGEYHVSDADDDYRGPDRVLWCIEPVYRRTKGQA